MGVATTLTERAERFGLQQDFRAVGAPALLVTNEITPAGFYDGVKERFAPDGYVFGPGCGNVLSMVEAFASTPRGLVLVDVDPAVVWAGRMLVAGLARHPTVESFAEDLFCRGSEPFDRLAEEVLQDETARELRRQMGDQRERLRKGLAALLSASPAGEARELLAGWASYYPPADRIVPVRTFLARNYSRLRELALGDCIAVLWGSIFDPGLLDLIAGLPGFRESRNLVYLSNAADHVLRRGLLATARASLLGRDAQRSGPGLASPEESLHFLNESVMESLRVLAAGARGAVFVYSKTRNDLILLAQAEVPRYGPGDLELSFRLDHAIVHFLEGIAASASLTSAEGPWRDARRLRETAIRLLIAALRGDEGGARRALRELAAKSSADPRHASFRVAETAQALLRVEGSALASPLTLELEEARSRIGEAARGLLGRKAHLLAAASGQAMTLLLYAQAFGLAGALLRDERLDEAGRELLAAGLDLQTEEGLFPYDGGAGVGQQAEALLRLAVYAAHRPGAALEAAMVRGAAALLRAVRSTGEIDLRSAPPLGAGGDGYLAYATDEGVLYETVRLALLFHSLVVEEIAPIDAALRVSFYVGHKAAEAPAETHVLVDEIL